MPFTIPPLSRRRFLAGSVAAGASQVLGKLVFGQTKPTVDPRRIAIISDLHIDADLKHVEGGINMADNLTHVVKQIVALDPQPACVLINGDLAHWHGHNEDYAAAAAILQPISAAGIPMHMTMGNHDVRANLWKAFAEAGRADKPVTDRAAAVITLPTVDWYILDSLLQTNGVPGVLGLAQILWLMTSLDAKPDRPAVVMIHHQPDLRPEPRGLIDTKALTDVITPRKQVKALIYGHTHRWEYAKQPDGQHWLNLPTTAYVFAKEMPSGWVDVHLADNGASFQLFALNEQHPKHLEKHEMTWR